MYFCKGMRLHDELIAIELVGRHILTNALFFNRYTPIPIMDPKKNSCKVIAVDEDCFIFLLDEGLFFYNRRPDLI